MATVAGQAKSSAQDLTAAAFYGAPPMDPQKRYEFWQAFWVLLVMGVLFLVGFFLAAIRGS